MLVSLLLLLTMIFAWIFLKPTFLNTLFSGDSGWYPKTPKKVGNVILRDSKDLVAVEVPSDWVVQDYSLSEGFITLLSVQSPDFTVNQAPNESGVNVVLPASLVSGAKLDIAVFESSSSLTNVPAGNIESTDEVTVGDIPAKYYVFSDYGFVGAVFHEVRFVRSNNNYYIKLSFNPETFPKGPEFFKFVLSTLTLNETL